MRPYYLIWYRTRYKRNTDPQNRCYDGAFISWEWAWTEWTGFGRYSKEDGLNSIKTFQQINPNDEYQFLPEGEKP